MEAAIHYAQMGLAVIPLHGKRPYFDNWPDIASTDQKQIEKWWHQQPTSNVGIATGKKSGIFVLDVDPKNGGQDSIDSLFHAHGLFVHTWTDITGSGGTHYYFRLPSFRVDNKVGLLPGIDIRGDGGQVVAPPSIHPETKRPYTWDGLKEPWDEPNGLQEAPLWLLELIEPKPQVKIGPSEIPIKIAKGVQHITLVSLAGQLRRIGLTPEEIFPTLNHVNLARCEQPGPEQNIWQIARSMNRYAPHDRNLYAEASKLWRLARFHEERAKEQDSQESSVDGYSLMLHPPKGPVEIVDGMLHNGITVFAGRPKIGKSWAALQLAIAVAYGVPFAGWAKVGSPGAVCYFALEESESRTGLRLQKLVPEKDIRLQNIQFFYQLKPIAEAGREQLLRAFERHRPTLVIVDTFLALCRGNGGRRDILRDDYKEIDALGQIARQAETAILLVHHLRKDAAGDTLDAVAGSTGITAAADCIWTLQRKPDRNALLTVVGREVEGVELLMNLDIRNGIGWSVQETGSDARHSEEQGELLMVLEEIGRATPKQLATELRKAPATVRKALQRSHDRGLVVRDGEYYRISNVKRIDGKRDT